MTSYDDTAVRIVLVNPSHPGNVGGVARAMKNMGLSRLYIVAPRYAVLDERAHARAAGAVDVLHEAVVVDTFNAAIADCHWVVGASARLRAIPWPTYDPPACAQDVVTLVRKQHAVALVFGREDTGLTNEELDRCHALLHIPANPQYSSLNLAAAVQVVCYEIYMAMRTALQQHLQVENDNPLATARDLEGLYAHLERTLTALDFYDPDNPKQLMRRLRRLFNRCRLDQMELNILRGMLNSVDVKLGGRP